MRKAAVMFAFFCLIPLANAAHATPSLQPRASAEIRRIAAETGIYPDYIVSPKSGIPTVITGNLSQRPRTPENPVTLARQFIEKHSKLFLVGSDSLKLWQHTSVGNGHSVRFEQTYKGIPVVGAHLTIFLRDDGVVKAVTSSLAEVSSSPTDPLVSDVDAAIQAAESIPAPIPVNPEGFYARLVIVPLPGAARLAWEMHFGAVPSLLSNIWAYVDAREGNLIKYENRIVFDHTGLVFETNPGPASARKAPTQAVLSMPEGGFEYQEPDYRLEMIEHVKTVCDYAEGKDDCPTGENIWLRHPLFMSRNCPDYHETTEINFGAPMTVHMCSEVQTAAADAEGNFIFADWQNSRGVYTDYFDPTKPETEIALNDKFAEVQMFYHVGKAYNYFLSLMDDYAGDDPQLEKYSRDWTGHGIRPLMATVNFKIPIDMTGGGMPDLAGLSEAMDPNGPLHPFDNAFFMPGGPAMGMAGLERPFDSIVFGQGSRADFGWDGDVIYHEFTHSVDQSVTGSGTAMFSEFGDEWGVNPEPGGMSEGYADAFPGFITNDPTMGEYSMAAMPGASVRDLAGDAKCPNYLVGEVHDDSHAWSQSLYQAREAVVETLKDEGNVEDVRHKYEQAVFVGLSSVVANQGFAEATAVTLSAIEDLLGDDARNAAAEVFAAHQTDDCPRFLSDDGKGFLKHHAGFLGLALPEAVSGVRGKPYTPGILQFKVTVGENIKAVNFSLMVGAPATSMGMATGVPKVRFLVRHDNPIQFSYDFGEAENVIVDEDVMGPYFPEIEGKVNQGGQQVTFSLIGKDSGSLPTGEYYIMPVNVGAARGAMHNMDITTGEPTADEQGTYEYGSPPRDPSANPDPEDTDPEDTDTSGIIDDDEPGPDSGLEDDGDSAKEGCGCNAVGTPSTSRGLAKKLLVLLYG